MAQAKSITDTPTFADTIVVDHDVHVTGSTAARREIAERLDEPWHSRMHPDIDTPGNYRKADAHPWTLPGKTHGNIQLNPDPETVDQDLCQRFGVDYPIVNMPGSLDSLPDQRNYAQRMQVHNDVFIEMFLEDYDHIYGNATIGLHEPALVAEEIDRMASEDKVVGFFMTSAGQERAPGDPRYHQIYEAAADNDMPIAFHGFGGPSINWNADGWSRGINKYTLHHIIAHPISQMWPTASLVTEGVLEKYPDLNIVLLESGVGWVPYMISWLNREYRHRPDELPELTKPPEEYIRDQMYFATQPMGEFRNPQHMQKLISAVGAESVVFSSDFPHYDVDTPETINNLLSHFSDEERDQVMHGNGLEIYDIPA